MQKPKANLQHRTWSGPTSGFYTYAPEAMLCDATLSHGAVRLYLLLTSVSRRVNKGTVGWVEISEEALADMLSVTRKTIRTWAVELEDHEFIETDKDEDRNERGRMTPKVYKPYPPEHLDYYVSPRPEGASPWVITTPAPRVKTTHGEEPWVESTQGQTSTNTGISEPWVVSTQGKNYPPIKKELNTKKEPTSSSTHTSDLEVLDAGASAPFLEEKSQGQEQRPNPKAYDDAHAFQDDPTDDLPAWMSQDGPTWLTQDVVDEYAALSDAHRDSMSESELENYQEAVYVFELHAPTKMYDETSRSLISVASGIRSLNPYWLPQDKLQRVWYGTHLEQVAI